jgi:hypothetical protein
MSKKVLILILILSAAFLFVGCKNKQQKALDDMINPSVDNKELVDPGDRKAPDSHGDWIAKYDKIVEEFEKKADAKTLTTKDFDDMQARLEEIGKLSKEQKGYTPAQIQKAAELSVRLSNVIRKFSTQQVTH